MVSPLDPFIPRYDIRERFEKIINAPVEVVMRTAYDFDLQSILPIRAIILLRELLLGSRRDKGPRKTLGLVAETRALGWGALVEVPDQLLVCGAHCQPWFGNVKFTAIPADDFAFFDLPDQVKIVWSLETTEIETNKTRFVHEVRAFATDDEARRKFMRYWSWARFGIIAIRLLLLPAIRRRAEHEWKSRSETETV